MARRKVKVRKSKTGCVNLKKCKAAKKEPITAKPVTKTSGIKVKPSTRNTVQEEVNKKIDKNKVAERIAEKLKLRKLLREKPLDSNLKPKKRRGRRPKPITEYNYDSNHEQDGITDVDYSRLEYDTGINVNKLSDDYEYDYDAFSDLSTKELDFDISR